MSKIKFVAGSSGTGTFTIEVPNSNTDRTLILPDATGTLAALGSGADLPRIVAVGRRTTTQNGISTSWDTSSAIGYKIPSSPTTILYDSQILDTYNQFDPTTGIFTVDAATVGWYEVRFHWQGNSLLRPEGTDASKTAEARAFAGIYKNDTSLQGRGDFLEDEQGTSAGNEDETRFGLDCSAIVDLTTSGDNVRVKCAYYTSSAAKQAESGTSITITRLTDSS